MAMPEYKVHEGLWTNLSAGKVKGATLTLSQTRGAYLIAFLALFVHLSGSSFWRFTSFILFRARAHLAPRDKTALQQQAILRNGPSAITALSNLVTAAIRSKKRWDSLALSSWALGNFIFFLAAGILSSKVAVNQQPEVLLQPTNCGRWWKFSFGGSEGDSIYNAMQLRDESLQYAAVRDLHLTSSRYKSICYDDSTLRKGCVWFSREPLSWRSALVPGCPFDDSICRDNSTFEIASEWIHSDRHFGINTQPEDSLRMQFRKSCSPLKRSGYFEMYDSSNVSTLIPHSDWARYIDGWKAFLAGDQSYGAFFYGPNTAGIGNATFMHSNSTQVPWFDSAPPIYTVVTDGHQDCTVPMVETGFCLSTFDPIASLRKPNRDLTLIFLTSKIQYCGPVTDPWFHAQMCHVDYEDRSVCRPAYPTNTLACAEETEICVGGSPERGVCVKIRTGGIPFLDGRLPNITKALNLNSRQASIASRMQDASSKSSLTEIITDMGGTNMLAYGTGSDLCAPRLPDDQWTKEIENWFATMLLNMQLYTTQFVTGSSDKEVNNYITLPKEDERWMCNAQIVRSEMYTNFSVIGILVILILGGSFITLRLCTPYLVHKLQPSSTENEHRRATWDELRLSELAFELFEKQRKVGSDDELMVSPVVSRTELTKG